MKHRFNNMKNLEMDLMIQPFLKHRRLNKKLKSWLCKLNALGLKHRRPHRRCCVEIEVSDMFNLPKKSSGCFICGRPHGYRDCPDKNRPSNFRGKGKSHYAFMADYEFYELYYTKGKSKGGMKGKKGKKLHMVDAFAMWKGKGKSKSKQSRPAVNAYYASETFYGFKMQPTLDLHATSKPDCSLIDCEATASAGREESVKGLISSISAVEKGASVVLVMLSGVKQTTGYPSPPM